MSYRALLLLLLLFPIGSLRAVERVQNSVFKTAVLIDAKVQSDTKSINGGLNLSLALAIRNYSNFYLATYGHLPEIKILDQTDSFENHISRMRLLDYNSIITITPQGKDRVRSNTVRDYHRRKFFTRSRGYLDLRLDYEIISLTNGRIEKRQTGRIKEQARQRWLKYSDQDDLNRYTFDSLVIVKPEPFAYIIQRSLDKIFSQVEPGTEIPPDSTTLLPTIVQIDSSLIETEKENWQKRVVQMTKSSSRYLKDNFGYSLNLERLIVMPNRIDNSQSLRSLQSQIRQATPDFGDTLVISVVGEADRFDYFFGESSDEIGLSELGQKFVIVKLIPSPTDDEKNWQSFFDGLTLLHEIGHAFGAIHVSDINSVMSHNSSWLGSDRFDSFNRTVISAALSGKLTFDSPSEYVRFISKTLSQISYGLVDYPAFLDNYLNYGNNRSISKKLSEAISHTPHLLATKAYRLLREKNREGAARLFNHALTFDSHQASLYYYLALATDGQTSLEAMEQAAKMGYWRAIIALHR